MVLQTIKLTEIAQQNKEEDDKFNNEDDNSMLKMRFRSSAKLSRNQNLIERQPVDIRDGAAAAGSVDRSKGKHKSGQNNDPIQYNNGRKESVKSYDKQPSLDNNTNIQAESYSTQAMDDDKLSMKAAIVSFILAMGVVMVVELSGMGATIVNELVLSSGAIKRIKIFKREGWTPRLLDTTKSVDDLAAATTDTGSLQTFRGVFRLITFNIRILKRVFESSWCVAFNEAGTKTTGTHRTMSRYLSNGAAHPWYASSEVTEEYTQQATAILKGILQKQVLNRSNEILNLFELEY